MKIHSEECIAVVFLLKYLFIFFYLFFIEYASKAKAITYC